MALKSSVFACLNLALCVSCNNIIIGRSAEPRGKETEKSKVPFWPRSAEHLGKETEQSPSFLPRSAEHLGKEPSFLPRSAEHLGKDPSFLPRSAEHLGKETEKSGGFWFP
ncbi:unnamed protein product [Durusdinium trenchii]|uniref:Uncharacterized protein n=1 Tax=Durusdinium trenchii TaxID=1381693 RepID=A0ABP0MP11_9DINO